MPILPSQFQFFDRAANGLAISRSSDMAWEGVAEDDALAEKLACAETWRFYPPRRSTSVFRPYTLDWFRDIEKRRYARHGQWITRLLEFHRHHGETVLGLGDGLGTDWVRYTECGADFYYCNSSAEMVAIVKRNFDLRGLSGRFIHSKPTDIPLLSGSIDVICLSFLSAQWSLPLDLLVAEIFRLLKPGGKLIAVLPAKYNSTYWQNILFPWKNLLAGSGNDPSFHWSDRSVRKLLAAFAISKIQKRHLRRADLPHVWRWMLLPYLERFMGRFLIVKSFKPLAQPVCVPLAA